MVMQVPGSKHHSHRRLSLCLVIDLEIANAQLYGGSLHRFFDVSEGVGGEEGHNLSLAVNE